MKTNLRNGALALAVIAGSALVAAPAMADHDRDNRHGDDWDHHQKKAWKHDRYDRDYAYRYRHRYHHHHHRYYGWGWPYFYRPGVSLYIR